jgi:hypothetical protein
MAVRISPKMEAELRHAAENGYQGTVAYCNNRTEDALINRDLITYQHNVTDKDGDAWLFPVLTPAGWALVQELSGTGRPADDGRMTPAEALEYAERLNGWGFPGCRGIRPGDGMHWDPKARVTVMDVPALDESWPMGTRVQIRLDANTGYRGRTGTVRQENRGVVDNPGHPNHGRTYVTVHMDPTDTIPWSSDTRQFVDDLEPEQADESVECECGTAWATRDAMLQAGHGDMVCVKENPRCTAGQVPETTSGNGTGCGAPAVVRVVWSDGKVSLLCAGHQEHFDHLKSQGYRTYAGAVKTDLSGTALPVEEKETVPEHVPEHVPDVVDNFRAVLESLDRESGSRIVIGRTPGRPGLTLDDLRALRRVLDDALEE